MGVAAAFIDGGYLNKVLFHELKGRRIDYQQLVSVMVAPDELLRAYYYHCLPYQASPPTEEERARFGAMQRFVTALTFLPRFEVRLGRLALRGTDASGKPIFVQKRVDTMVSVDMALLAGKGKITKVALLSGDSDCIPAIEAVKREGVLVTLWHGRFRSEIAPGRELFAVCDERREITPELLGRLER